MAQVFIVVRLQGLLSCPTPLPESPTQEFEITTHQTPSIDEEAAYRLSSAKLNTESYYGRTNPSLLTLYPVFDGGSMGLKGGMAVVEVVVKWNDGGIGEEVVVKGRRMLPCTFCAFWITASKLLEKS
ncbi:hypothetical protein Tco_1247024 [Tanacetum coccineum]